MHQKIYWLVEIVFLRWRYFFEVETAYLSTNLLAVLHVLKKAGLVLYRTCLRYKFYITKGVLILYCIHTRGVDLRCVLIATKNLNTGFAFLRVYTARCARECLLFFDGQYIYYIIHCVLTMPKLFLPVLLLS